MERSRSAAERARDSSTTPRGSLDPWPEFSAPFLVQRLCDLGLAADRERAAALVLEVKRYLWIACAERSRAVPMYSALVDEAWHQFILFTAEYRAFCQRFAGHYLHHTPVQRGSGAGGGESPMRFDEFQETYARRFGELSPLWRDELSLAPQSRVARGSDWAPFTVRVEAGRAVLYGGPPPQSVLCRTNARAETALRFIAAEPRFLVREVPGLAHPEERIALLSPLVQLRIFTLAP